MDGALQKLAIPSVSGSDSSQIAICGIPGILDYHNIAEWTYKYI